MSTNTDTINLAADAITDGDAIATALDAMIEDAKPTPGRKPAAKKKKGGATSAIIKPGTSLVFADVPDPRVCEETASLPRTRMGLAERVERHYGHVLAYRTDMGSWFAYTGRVWARDPDGILARAAVRSVIRSITTHEAEIAADSDPEVAMLRASITALENNGLPVDPRMLEDAAKAAAAAAKGHREFGEKCENNGAAVSEALDALKAPLTVPEDEWDSHPFLINFPNGTANLKYADADGNPVLRDHDPADRITMITAVDYVPDATIDSLDSVRRHLNQTGDGTYECVIRYLGYSLTGAMDAKVFMNLYGERDAAKSTLTGATAVAIGGKALTSYAAFITPDDLGVRDGSKPVPALDDCRGRRLIVVPEAEHAYLGSDLVKRWTGGDVIRTRTLNDRGSQWSPAGKFLLTGNGASAFAAHDEGMQERLIAIKVEKIAAENIDTSVKHRLETTQEGQEAVLAAVVRAAREWYVAYKIEGKTAKEALNIPAHAVRTKSEHLREINPLTEWLDHETREVDEATADDAGRVTSTQALACFNRWRRNQGLPPMTLREFTRNLRQAGYSGVTNPTEFTHHYDSGGFLANRGKMRTGFRVTNLKLWDRAVRGEL